MEASKRIIKNTIYLYIKTGITLFIWLYTTRVILNSLGATDFGIYNVVGGAIGLLGFLNATMATTIQRFLNYEEAKKDIIRQRTIFNIGLIFHFVIALILVIIFISLYYLLFNGILNIPEDRYFAAKIIYFCLVTSTVFTVLTVPYDAVINSHENMLYYSIIGVFENILKLVVAIIIMHTTYDKLVMYGVLMSVIPFISLSLMRYYCHKKYDECKINPKKYYEKDLAKSIIKFAGWNFVGTSSSVVGNHGINIVLNHFFGAAINTAAGIASQIQGQLLVLSNNMLKALNPVLAKEEGAGNTNNLLKYSINGCKYSYFLFAIFAIPFFIETPYLLKIWLGDVPQWGILFVRLQLIRGLLEGFTMPLKKTLEAKGQIKQYNIAVFVLNLVPIILLSILYTIGLDPYWHYIIAIMFMVVIVDAIKVYYCKLYCQLNLKVLANVVFLPCTLITILAFIMGIIPTVICEMSFIRLILTTILTTIIILYGIYNTLNISEKDILKLYLSKILKR